MGPAGELSGPISTLAMRPQITSLDKMRMVVEMLEDIREEDPKMASVASMAIHVLRNGNEGMDKFKVSGRSPAE